MRNIQDSINWCEPYLSGKPMFLATLMEPALTNANIILQTILGPPFRWRWNRATSAPFASVVGATDNAVALADFRYIEKAYLALANNPTQEIPNIVDVLGPSSASETDRPHSICSLLDDNAGNITFRVQPAYDKIYQVSVLYQKKAALMQSLAASWSPLPDEFAYIYNHGFLALALMFDEDPRFQLINQRFVSALLAEAEGLTETQRNQFVERWGAMIGQGDAAMLRTRQGSNARGGI